MSQIILSKVAAPSTPAANKLTLYVDTTTRRVMSKDDNGLTASLSHNGLDDRNILLNGGLYIQQRVATASTAIPSVSTTTRAGQVADGWAVTTGNVTTTSWSQVDTAAANESGLLARYYGRITQATNAAKFIFSQWILNADMMHLRGQEVRLSLKLKQFVGSAQTYKLGLLQLTAAGTVDTSPAFISAIGGDGVTPTWGTNLSAITPNSAPTPENGTVNGSFVDITSTAGWVKTSAVFTVPTDAKNLVFVLWKSAAGGATDSVGIAELQLTQGQDIVDFIQPPFAEELIKCQRRFCKSFPLTTVPAAGIAEATAGGGAKGYIGKAGATALAAVINIQFPVVMWKIPTVTLYTPIGAGAVPYRITGTTPAVQTSVAQRGLMDYGLTVTATGDANGAVGDLCGVHYTADAEIVA